MDIRFILIIALTISSGARAQTGDGDLSNGEAWCDINAANCVCSEPLHATDYLAGAQTSDTPSAPTNRRNWNPNDTTSNQCSNEATNAPIRTSSWMVQPSDRVTTNNPTGTTLNDEAYDATRLPNRVTEFTQRFLGEQYEGGFGGSASHQVPWVSINYFMHKYSFTPAFASHRGRRSMRWYNYFPEDFAWETSAQQNAKRWQSMIGTYWTMDPPPGYRMRHNKSSSSGYICNGGVTGAGYLHMDSSKAPVTDYDAAYWQGVWIRNEIVIDNANVNASDPGAGNGTRIRWYHKNITTGDPEVVWLDTYNTTTTGPWVNTNPNGIRVDSTEWNCGGQTDLFRTNETFDNWRNERYAQNSAKSATNPAWRGFAYMQVAAWTAAEMSSFDLYGTDVWNDADFRIGSAYEMEGVAGEIDPHIVKPADTSPMIVE